jgi:hypothetical protein
MVDSTMQSILRDAEFYKFLRGHPDIRLGLETLTLSTHPRRKLIELLNEIKTLLPRAVSLHIEDILDELAKYGPAGQNKFKNAVSERSDEMKTLISRSRDEANGILNAGVDDALATLAEKARENGRKFGLVITETISEYDRYTFENMAKAEEKGIPCYFAYGDTLKTEEEAEAFVRATGYKGDMTKLRQRFINKGASYETLAESIAKKEGIADANNVGILAAEGELKKGEKLAGIVLEVKAIRINGRDVYVTIDAYRTLIKILTKGITLESGVLLPGVEKEGGVFKYLPRMIPIDYAEEIEIYRTAVRLIQTAA